MIARMRRDFPVISLLFPVIFAGFGAIILSLLHILHFAAPLYRDLQGPAATRLLELHPFAETRKLGTCCGCCCGRDLGITSWKRPKLRQHCFELGWRAIAQGRVQSLSIIEVFDEGADRLTGVVEILTPLLPPPYA